MARYEQLHVRKDVLFLEGSPVTITAEALLADNKEKTISAQVKFTNIGHQKIDALVAEYKPVAAMGRELEPVIYQYRCDGAVPGSEFGQTEPVKLPDETVDFSSRVLRVSFTNGDTWDAPEQSEWKKLPNQEKLAEVIDDGRLLDQYAISVGAGLTYVARELGSGSWVCGCNAINGPGRTTCLSCHNSLANQLSHLDKDLLGREATKREEEEREKAERQARLAAERAAKEAEEVERKRIEEERLAAEKEAQNKKVKKIFAVVCIAAALVAVAFVVYNSVLVPKSKYDAALAMAEEGNFEDAISALQELGDYGDAEQQIEAIEGRRLQALYGEGMSLYESGKYAEAYKIFDGLHMPDSSEDEMKRKSAEEAGKQAEASKDYAKAVEWYQKADDEESANSAKYQYVMSHFGRDDSTTVSYLESLASSGYKDTEELLKKLYAWEYDMELITTRDGYISEVIAAFELHINKAYNGREGDKKTIHMEYTDVKNGGMTSKDYTLVSSPSIEGRPGHEYMEFYLGSDKGSVGSFELKVTDVETGELIYQKSLTRQDWTN